MTVRRIRPQPGLSNRDIAKTSKGARRYWCMGCDANLVSQTDICSVCGRRSREEKFNKPATIPAPDIT
jgi:predicted amidophosphoribosyltransferase